MNLQIFGLVGNISPAELADDFKRIIDLELGQFKMSRALVMKIPY
jgi:hypothetical protein